MSRIFISHSSVNAAEAIALRDWLDSEGWQDEYFLDLDPDRGLVAGQRWERALYEAVNRCEAVLFLVSKDWLASQWCQKEFDLAHKNNKRLFGVLIEELALPKIPEKMTRAWHVVRLAAGQDHIQFRVTLPITHSEAYVTYSAEGLARLRTGLQEAGLNAKYFPWPPASDPNRSPYRGLSPLEAEDAGIFFGRDGAIVETLDSLRGLRDEAPPRVFVIQAGSGAGKSSFMRAGLIPRLARDNRRFLLLPTIRPERAVLTGTTGLAASVAKAGNTRGLKDNQADIRTAVEAGAASLRPLLTKLVEDFRVPCIEDGMPPPDLPALVLPIDQAEELLAGEGQREAQLFQVLLRDLLSEDAPRFIALVTIRSETYERFYEWLWPKQDQTQETRDREPKRQHTFHLLPLPKGAYSEVIKGPAQRLKGTKRELKIEETLTDALLADLEHGGSKDALPLLAFTLERLYLEYGADGDLTLAEYRKLNGLEGSIDAAVERAFEAANSDPAIPKDRQARLTLLRRGFVPWLARVDPDSKTPRRRVARLSEVPVEAQQLILQLVEQRLLTTDKDENTGEKTIEPAHEALLRQWGLLNGWLKDDFAALSVLEGIQRASRDWAANDKDEAWLVHRGGRLREVEGLRAREDLFGVLEPTDLEYLAACTASRIPLAFLRFLLRTVAVGAWATGLAILLLLAVAPQLREVYLGTLERADYAKGFLSMALLLVLGGLLASWHYTVSTGKIDRLYSLHVDKRIDRRLKQARGLFGVFLTCLPILGVSIGMWALASEYRRFAGLSQNLGKVVIEYNFATKLLTFFAAAGSILTVLQLLVGFAAAGRARHISRLTTWAGVGVSFSAFTGLLLEPTVIVQTSRLLGPLTMASIGLITFVTLLIGAAHLSQRISVPLIGISALFMLSWTLRPWLTSRSPQAVSSPSVSTTLDDPGHFVKVARVWFNSRQDLIRPNKAGDFKPYPVFVIAAQGGGIDAAAATSLFLAQMQDKCPNFAQHVFAISGVSGGSIGAALFSVELQARDEAKSLQPEIGCRQPLGENRLSARMQEVLRQDHLSPQLALIWPDIVRSFYPRRLPFPTRLRVSDDRAGILAKSLACSLENDCSGRGGTRSIDLGFKSAWAPIGPAPALVMNLTWVETGYRAAFAPFPLSSISDGTLQDTWTFDYGASSDISLIEAAVASARAPPMLPSLQLGNRGRYADGGFVDNSGVTTALEIYRAVSTVLERESDLMGRANSAPSFSLHLILLTDDANEASPLSSTLLEPSNVLNEPIVATLNAQSQSSRSARYRARLELGEFENEAKLADGSKPVKLLVVQLGPRRLGSGWVTSAQTHDSMSLRLGDAERCKVRVVEKPSTPAEHKAEEVIWNNSCVKKRIEEMLSVHPVSEQ